MHVFRYIQLAWVLICWKHFGFQPNHLQYQLLSKLILVFNFLWLSLLPFDQRMWFDYFWSWATRTVFKFGRRQKPRILPSPQKIFLGVMEDTWLLQPPKLEASSNDVISTVEMTSYEGCTDGVILSADMISFFNPNYGRSSICRLRIRGFSRLHNLKNVLKSTSLRIEKFENR